MYRECASYSKLQACIDRNECKAERCFFPWTVRNFWAEVEKSSYPIGTRMFSPTGNSEVFTLWKIDLCLSGPQNDISIRLRRTKSQNTCPVLVRFHWELLDVQRNKIFPGSIHAIVYPEDQISKIFVTNRCLLENKDRILDRGDLHVLCEICVYERTIEDTISARVNANVPFGLWMLSERMEKLFQSECSTDLRISALDSEMKGHRSILSARSHVFAELLEKMKNDSCRLNLSNLKSDVLHCILMHLYCGSIDLYLVHTIPKDLYSEAKKYDLRHLQKHLDSVLSNNLTTLKSIDVTWKIPLFNTLILQPKTVLYCPDPNRTLFDNRWCFKLEFESSRDEVDISVIRKHGECSEHIKFTVQVETDGKTSFERSTFFTFETEEVKRMEPFMRKDELGSLVSFRDTLVLKCSLEVFTRSNVPEQQSKNSLSSIIEDFAGNMESSLQQLSKDLHSLFDKETFSDVSVKTKIGELRFHSYIVEARFCSFLEDDLNVFLENLDPKLVVPFFVFTYGGDITKKQATKLHLAALMHDSRKIIEEFENFLCHLDNSEVDSETA